MKEDGLVGDRLPSIGGLPVNATNRLALKAKAKAEAMGWEVRAQYDQSDVLDFATVVAWPPGSKRLRVIRFIEGRESIRGWRPMAHLECLLDYQNALG